jgi:ATP-dependent Lon protease
MEQVKVLVEGIKRVKILDFKDNDKYITCDYAHYNDVVTKDEDLYPLAANSFKTIRKINFY